MERIGETAIASTLSYLDNGFVFVGSTFGDSQVIHWPLSSCCFAAVLLLQLPLLYLQLVKLSADAEDSGVTVMESYMSLGPIVDACVVDLDRQGQCQVVTCSGAFKNASLRVVRSGIGVEEQAVIELPGIKSVWSLRKSFESHFDTYLVQSYVSETRVFGIEGEEMEERTFDALIADVSSLYCGNCIHDTIVQVTPSEVRLLQHSLDGSLSLLQSWTPPAGSRITVASGNGSQILVALNGGVLVLLTVSKPAGAPVLSKTAETTLPHEVSCISVQPLAATDADGDVSTSAAITAPFAAVGLWKDASVRLLALVSTYNLLSVLGI